MQSHKFHCPGRMVSKLSRTPAGGCSTHTPILCSVHTPVPLVSQSPHVTQGLHTHHTHIRSWELPWHLMPQGLLPAPSSEGRRRWQQSVGAFAHSCWWLVNPSTGSLCSSTHAVQHRLSQEAPSSELFEHSLTMCMHLFISQIDFCAGT